MIHSPPIAQASHQKADGASRQGQNQADDNTDNHLGTGLYSETYQIEQYDFQVQKMNDAGVKRVPWRNVHRVRLIATFCTTIAVVLNASPVLASDPTGTFSGVYAFLLVIPWVALNLVLTVAIAIRGGYRSAASANLHATVGAALPLIGFGVTAFDYFVVRKPSTPWPGIETILISIGLCILGVVACLLAPLLVRRNMNRRSD